MSEETKQDQAGKGRGLLAVYFASLKTDLGTQVFTALVLGITIGSLVKGATDAGWIAGAGLTVTHFIFDDTLGLGGFIFVTLLKMLVVPLVLVSLVNGVCSLGGGAALGRIAGKTFALYLVTTAVAVMLALTLGTLINPGEGINLATAEAFAGKEAPPLVQTLKNMIPPNPFTSLSTGSMIQVIFFALLLGMAIRAAGEKGERVAQAFSDWNEIVMKLVGFVITLAPFGVFCLLGSTFAVKGIGIIGNLAYYFFGVLAGLFLHFTLVHSSIVTLARLNYVHFLRKMMRPLVFAFSTSSSGATIPVNLENARKNLGVGSSVASFTIPLGATINMDGTAIMQGMATMFIAGAVGVELGLTEYLLVILTATLASIGTAGVPSVGLITLTMVLTQIGLPVEGVALIIGIDKLLDMTRTSVNITGDSAISCLVARSEGELDDEIFKRDPV